MRAAAHLRRGSVVCQTAWSMGIAAPPDEEALAAAVAADQAHHRALRAAGIAPLAVGRPAH